MRKTLFICAIALLTGAAAAEAGVPIAQLVQTVAQKTGKQFVLDSGVQGDVTLIGQDPATVDYDQLLTLLQAQGFAAVESGGYVRVVPEAGVRALGTPIAAGDRKLADATYVSKVIEVASLRAEQLVPILRPLIPRQGHLAAVPCANALVMVDTQANVQRIEALVRSLDSGEPRVALARRQSTECRKSR